MDEAREYGGVFFIEVTADEAVIMSRLKQKRLESEADFDVYKKIQLQWEPLKDSHLVLQSTNDNIEDMLHKAAFYLNLKNDQRTDK